MTEMLWTFRALDTFFFRDGSPFNAGESSQFGVAGTFPPSMFTLQGAIRTTLAQARGWCPGSGYHEWPQELGGPQDIGKLSLRGPYLRNKAHWLFPAPAFLLGIPLRHEESTQTRQDQRICFETFVRLAPGPEEVLTDLGPVRLPAPSAPAQEARALTGRWLSADVLERLLAAPDEVPQPAEVVASVSLWKAEPRIGIQRDPNTHTVTEGQMYSSVHTRLAHGLELAVVVSGISEDWHPRTPFTVRLGGEGRTAGVEVTESSGPRLRLPPLRPVGSRLHFTVTLLTPGRFGEATRLVLEHGPPGIPGICVSVCAGRAYRIGGWDLRNHAPRPLEPTVPAGTTWFYTAPASQLEAVLALQHQCVGEQTRYGFGEIALGVWEERA